MKQNPFRQLILGIYGLIILLPLSLVLLTTFKTTPELYSNLIGLPAGWNIENYKQLLVNEPIFGYIKNSVIVTVFSTFFILWFSSMIAYAIIQLPQKLGWIVYGFFVCGMIVPTQVNMIPVFLLMNKLGLVNTLNRRHYRLHKLFASHRCVYYHGVYENFAKGTIRSLLAWTERQSGKYIQKSLFDSQYHQWLQWEFFRL